MYHISSMEKASLSRSLYHCLSLVELVGFLILDSILIWVIKIHKLISLRLFSTCSSSRNDHIGECKNAIHEAKEEEREDVDMIMARLGMPFIKSRSYVNHEISTIFQEEEPCLLEVKEAFRIFDENCDGFIDAMELQKVLCNLGFREGEHLNACQQMIDTYDENKDGKIDFHEFFRFMESSFC